MTVYIVKNDNGRIYGVFHKKGDAISRLKEEFAYWQNRAKEEQWDEEYTHMVWRGNWFCVSNEFDEYTACNIEEHEVL